jgi:Domain of Unknown Function with PDB structure (DUF3857)
LNFSPHPARGTSPSPHAVTPRAAGSAARILLGLLVVCLAAPAAPRRDAAAEEWLPIAPQDLAMKSNPALPGSHAMALYSETKWDLENAATFEYVRIKIFDVAGLKYAEAEAEYPSSLYSVEDLRARTIHPDGSIAEFAGAPVVRRKRNISGSHLVAAFTCPAATPGSIVEYQYAVRFHRERVRWEMREFPMAGDLAQMITESRFFDWPVRGELSVRHARFMLHPPAINLPGFAAIGGVRPGYPHYRAEDLPPNATLTTDKLATLVCDERDVPPAPEEAFPSPEGERTVHIEMYFAEHKHETRREFWGRYAADQQSTEEQALRAMKLARRIAEQTAGKGGTPETALGKLYARAQQIRNRTYGFELEEHGAKSEPLLMNQTAEEALKRGEGTSDDINLAFLALARAAGFDAEMIWLAPRNRRRFDLDRFDWSQLSQSAVVVRLPDGEVVVDPGTPFCPIGLLPWPKAEAGGFRVTKGNINSIVTPGLELRASGVERKGELALSRDGWLRGTVQAEFYGQEALELRIEEAEMNEEERAKTLTERFRQWLPSGSNIESVTATGWDTEQGPLHAQFAVSVPPQTGARGEATAALTATVAGQANPFESPERSQAVCFPYPFQELDEITIALPKGMEAGPLTPLREARMELPGEIISAPENGESTGLRRRRPGEVPVAAYQNLRKEGKGSITVVRRLLVNLTDVPVAHYAKLRNFFQQVHAGDSETVAVSAGTK